jgi:hypothetical protein
MVRNEPVVRAAFLPSLSVRSAWHRASGRRRAVVVAVASAVVLAAGLLITLVPPGHPAAAPRVPTSRVYDQTVGPGCPQTTLANATQDNFADTHKWVQATAAQWSVPGCSNLLVYSTPTTASTPDRWQNLYTWYFDNVPKSASCSFLIYIPDSPYAQYTAAYDWTAGESYLESTAFFIHQAAYRGQWFPSGPHRFSTGQAVMMLNDSRSDTPNDTLAAAAVRLTCK